MKIFIANLMTQPGETDGYDLRQHLDTVKEYAPQIKFDAVIVNNRSINAEQTHIYAADGARQVDLDGNLDDPGILVIRADLLDEGDMVRHNSARLARVVLICTESFCRDQAELAVV